MQDGQHPAPGEMVTVTACLPVHGHGHRARRSRVTKGAAESLLLRCGCISLARQLFCGGEGVVVLGCPLFPFPDPNPTAGILLTPAACIAGPITPPPPHSPPHH